MFYRMLILVSVFSTVVYAQHGVTSRVVRVKQQPIEFNYRQTVIELPEVGVNRSRYYRSAPVVVPKKAVHFSAANAKLKDHKMPVPFKAKSDNWHWPLPNTPQNTIITSGFGKRFYRGVWQKHYAADARAKPGTRLEAAIDGGVKAASYTRCNGHFILLENTRQRALTLHGSKNFVRRGQLVKKGQLIGLTGGMGCNISGPHLDLRTWEKEGGVWKVRDPERLNWGGVKLRRAGYKKPIKVPARKVARSRR